MPHTPGPWEMNVGIDGAVVYHPDQGTIADVPMDLSDHPHNARLMAAAPDLLEALEELLHAPDPDEVEDFTPLYRAITKAHAAIAKAKGEQQ